VCRFLAYLGPDVSLESLLLAPPWSLLRQSYEPRFMKRGRVNADGFGAGWYDLGVRAEPALYRRATPIWSDRTFASIAGLAHSGAILAAVRNATAPSPTEESNTPPFASGPWLFAHNGEVTGFAGGGRRTLLAGISDRRAAGIAGSADSEVLFAMVLDRIDAGAPPAAALCSVVGAVMESTGGRLNMVLTNGRTIAATACGDSLYVHDEAPAFVVASEPYDDREGWREVPDGSVIEVPEPGTPHRLRIGGMSR
jgi:gamma-glutamyl hercynylcysteine S-oxide hydrolase